MKIKIELSSLREITKILINTDVSVVSYNGKVVDMDISNLTKKLYRIISYWEREYIDNVFDAESFVIKITDEEKTVNYMGCGRYPDNYAEFLQLIKEIKNAAN